MSMERIQPDCLLLFATFLNGAWKVRFLSILDDSIRWLSSVLLYRVYWDKES